MKSNALIFTTISILLFILIQDEHWLYGWDFLDMIFLTALLIGIDRKWNLKFFTILFVLALTNRETALFIPLWIFIDSISKKQFKITAYSIGLALVGIGAIYFLRENLFLGSCQGYIGMDATHPYGNHFWLKENLSSPLKTFPPWKPELSLIPAISIATILYFACQWKSLNTTNRSIVILMVSMAAIIFFTVVIHETRSWFVLIPFIIYLIHSKSK
jgi:hypothetical protein